MRKLPVERLLEIEGIINNEKDMHKYWYNSKIFIRTKFLHKKYK